MQEPIGVAIVGTGFAARMRAEAFNADGRSRLLAVAGRRSQAVAEFAQTHGATPWTDWRAMVAAPEVDLVVVCHSNGGHGEVVRGALEAGKGVVVEYPLATDFQEAQGLVALAQQRGLLLHVEHIELLGGMHQALRQFLPAIGRPLHGRYSTATPQAPAPQKWTYQAGAFGFPLVAALSRIHRFTDLFGPVAQVQGWVQYDEGQTTPPPEFFHTCRCGATLQFASGLVAEVFYGKGELVRHPSRDMVIEGTAGSLVFIGDRGELITPEGVTALEVGGRRGLFAQDTGQVLAHLLEGAPLYVSPQASLYALAVASAIATSAQGGGTPQPVMADFPTAVSP